MQTFSMTMTGNAVVKFNSVKERLSDPNYQPLELVRIYNGLISALNLAIQSIQSGSAGQVDRDPNEDAELALKDLRDFFTPSYLHSFIDDLDDVLNFAEICRDARIVLDSIQRKA